MTTRTWNPSRLLLALWLLSGCQQILGIEEQTREDGQDGGEGEGDDAGDAGVVEFSTPSTKDCSAYCDVLDQACNPTSSAAAFKERSYCEGLCGFMQSTQGKDETGNTFECRLQQAKLARSVGTGDNSTECKASGAGGNGECGSNCEGYCQLFAAACADYPELLRGETCVSECEKLPIDATKNAAAAFGSGADTLQCRLAHLGAAAVAPMTAVTHCPHAAIAPAPGTPCQPVTPSCDDYCTLTMNTCTGKVQQYDSQADCVATCKSGLTLTEPLSPDEASDLTHDTVACRRYHAYNALKAPPGSTHCEHAGPSGDGHCGRICPAYCKIAKGACKEQYAATYASDDACQKDCANVLGIADVQNQLDQHYSIVKGKAGDDPIACRIYHATKAFRAGATECASVLGLAAGACKP